MAAVKGIDVSVWQGSTVDFNKVKKAGYDFVILRAGYGKYASQKDKYFESNYAKAKAAGLGVGAYWYSYATDARGAKEEAKVFAEVIAGKQFEYPLAFDIEDATQASLPKDTIAVMCTEFCNYLESRGYYVCLYSYSSFLNNKIHASTRNKYDVWLAEFTTASKPSYKGEYGIWQHSSTGKVNGINGDVDLNRAYKDYPVIMKSKGLNGFKMEVKPKEPKTEAKPTYEPGDANLDGKVDVADVMAVTAHAKNIKPIADEAVKTADVNGDGKIDISDVAEITKKAKNIPDTNVESDEWLSSKECLQI